MFNPKLKKAFITMFDEMFPNGWIELASDAFYIVHPEEGLVISLYQDTRKRTVVVARLTEETFLKHYRETGRMLDTDTEYDLTFVACDVKTHVLKELTHWMIIDIPKMRKPKVHTLTLGNSAHPVAKYGITAKRVCSDKDNYENCFYLEVDNHCVLINSREKWMTLIKGKGVLSGLDILKELADLGVSSDTTKYELKATNKYIGNDVMELVKELLPSK